MLDRIKAWLSKGGAENGADGFALRLALAALLVEAALMDGAFEDSEREIIAQLLRSAFSLDETECAALIAKAEAAQSNSTQLYGFTRPLMDGLPPEDRVKVIEYLWAVAYADGKLDPYEDHLIRRIAGLMHVSDRERGEARKRALMGAAGEPA